MIAVLALVLLAYLLGTFPSAALVARRSGKDVTQEGSGNPGASNITRMLGWKAGAVVLLLDMGKGALAAGVGLALDGHRGAYILGVAAVLGHVFPITRRFKGGRGVATAGGVLAVVFPLPMVVLAVVWFAIARGLKKASIASVVCALLFPTIVAVRGGSALDIAVTSGLAAIVILRHLANLRRLVRGEEHSIDHPTGTSTDSGPDSS
ncbi:MAG TPA: glycerol-3-phosphate 1-O-acyltransferase PlsY [Acidimicrobiia bacterium]